MEFKEEFIEILNQTLESPTYDLEESPEGRIGGFIISASFEEMEPTDRVGLVWRTIEQLSQEKQSKVAALLTVTPQEFEDRVEKYHGS